MAEASAPSLVISQLKLTSSNGQFVTLYNTGQTALDMSKYQLEYFNHYDLSKATSSKLISLSGIVPPHGYYMINDGTLLLCYQLTIDSATLGLSTTAGLLQLLSLNQSNPGNPANLGLQDYVSWSKTAAAGVTTLPSNTNVFLQRQPMDVNNSLAISAAGSGSWQTVQPDPANTCKLISGSGITIQTGMNQLLSASEPPATILSLNSEESSATASSASLPAADIGLMAPKLTELLPNPNGTGNDATNEFVELYNPNAVSFDLSGFGLQVGTNSVHNYSFPSGTSLPPHSFTAFYSSTTGLSLANSGGQVKLLDPFGNSISSSEIYSIAKDGQAWALANGKWYWTTKLTPSTANIINQPISTKKSSTKITSSKSKTSTKPQANKKSKTNSSSYVGGQDDEASSTPIHPGALALVATTALLYGAYEYRTDLANRIFQLRRYFAARRANRAQT
ncbi:MAG: lamin tail domain-containing protein [Patescibacteria group bacterium]